MTNIKNNSSKIVILAILIGMLIILVQQNIYASEINPVSAEENSESDILSGECGDNLSWTLSAGELVISGSGEMYDYAANEVPWYYEKDKITKVSLGDNITKIGKYAFDNCPNLTYIDIPQTIEIIGERAFANCSSLNKVDFHDNISIIKNEKGEEVPFSLSVGNYAFYYCKNLEEIILPVQTTIIGQEIITGTKITNIIIPKNIIKNDSWNSSSGPFTYANNLETVIFEEGTKNIPDYICCSGSGGLTGNSSLTKIVIPDSVERIGNQAFQNCKYLTNIDIPKSVSEIASSAFSGCVRLKEVVFHDNTTVTEDEDGKEVPFSLQIGSYAFSDCEALTGLELPVQVEYLGSGFISGTGITEFFVPKRVTRCDSNSPFLGAEGLEKVTFEEGTKEILNYMCSAGTGSNAIKEVVIPSSVTKIGYNSFHNCKYLTSIDVPEGVTEIGGSAFSGCVRLKEVVFHDNTTVTEDEDGKEVPFSLQIGSYAFSDCEALTGLELPVQVEYLGSGFISGTGITEFFVPKRVTRCDSNSPFLGAEGLEKVTFEEGTKEILNYMCSAGTGSNAIKKVVIPSSVTKIGNNSFYNCTNVTIYGWFGSYAETYANNNNIPFASIDDLVEDTEDEGDEQKLYVTTSFDDGSRQKLLRWTEDGYSEKEINLNIALNNVSEDVTVKKIKVELHDLKMFKVKDSVDETNYLTTYYYDVDQEQNIAKGEAAEFQLTLVKKGLTWWKPKDAQEHSGLINITIIAEKKNGSEISNDINGMNQLLISYQNDIEIQEQKDDEEQAIEEAEQNAENEAKDAVNEFVDLSDKMVLDPNIETYIGKNQFEALKMLIYTEISLANISKSYFTFSGISDEYVEQMMKTYLGYTDIDFGISSKEVPISVVVLGDDGNQYQFQLNCNVTAYSSNGLEFVIFGNIDTKMWKVSAPNKKELEIPCADGIINKGSIENFSKAVWNVASASLLSAYKLVWGNDADKIANGIIESSIDSFASKAAKYGLEKPVQIILKNYYEKNLKSKFSEKFFRLLIYPSKMVVVQCPVDVYIYDSDNVLVGSIIDNIVTMDKDGVALWTEGDDKYIQVFNGNYKITYKATGEGTMSLDIYDQMLNNINYRMCEISLVPLSEGIEYTQSLNQELLTDINNYELMSSQGTRIEVDKEEISKIDLYPEKDTNQSNGNSEEKPENDGKKPSDQTGNNSSTGAIIIDGEKESNNNDKSIIPSVGTIFNDSQSIYMVSKRGKEVAYKGSTNKKIVIIPNYITVNGVQYKVTSIADNALKNNKTVTTIKIGNNVTSIGANAFSGCNKLKSVTIGKNVTAIGNNAFKNCTSLKKVIIPARVTSIGKNAFAGCKKLKNVIVKTKVLKKIGKNAFKGINKAARLKVPKKQLKKYQKLFKKAKLSKGITITK